jgi:hypothetical protein
MCAEQNLTPIWFVAGEKGIYGDNAGQMTFGGRHSHSTFYHMDETGQFVGKCCLAEDDLSDTQKQEFLAGN